MSSGTLLRHSVLDHGYLQLVDHMGTDLSVVRSARVSYDGKATNSDDKLIDYLMKHKHNTPFESCTLTFEVKAPIFVIRQWHRHRTQSYSEISARYSELPAEFYIPELNQITNQSTDNKQMRTDEINPNAARIQGLIQGTSEGVFRTYSELLRLGCPRELARSVLPVGTYTKMFATSNLLNWYKFLGLRLHPHAQYEVRVYAEAILKIVEQLYPVSTAAFKRYHLGEENHGT